MEKVTLNVTGMSCGHCAARVEAALNEVAGVKKSKVNLKKAQAKVQYDAAQATTDELLKAVQAAGYQGGL